MYSTFYWIIEYIVRTGCFLLLSALRCWDVCKVISLSRSSPFFFWAEDNYDPTLAVDAIAHARLCMHNAKEKYWTNSSTFLASKTRRCTRYTSRFIFLLFCFLSFFLSARLKWLAFWIMLHDFNRRVGSVRKLSAMAPLFSKRACARVFLFFRVFHLSLSRLFFFLSVLSGSILFFFFFAMATLLFLSSHFLFFVNEYHQKRERKKKEDKVVGQKTMWAWFHWTWIQSQPFIRRSGSFLVCVCVCVCVCS